MKTRPETQFVAPGVDPFYWMRENNRKREYDYERGRETAILSIMQRLEANVRKGQTPESVEPIVAAWAGNWAKWIRVETTQSAKYTKQRRVILNAANPAVTMTLRAKLPELVSQLKPLGITEVMFR